MEDKIQEVEQYFRDKLISGDYVVKSIDRFTWSVLVDDKYVFSLWVANGEYGCGINNTIDKSYMSFELSDEDKREFWSNLNPLIIAHERDVNMEIKRKQFEALKIELNIE